VAIYVSICFYEISAGRSAEIPFLRLVIQRKMMEYDASFYLLDYCCSVVTGSEMDLQRDENLFWFLLLFLD
jgi:hypothetical protein